MKCRVYILDVWMIMRWCELSWGGAAYSVVVWTIRWGGVDYDEVMCIIMEWYGLSWGCLDFLESVWIIMMRCRLSGGGVRRQVFRKSHTFKCIQKKKIIYRRFTRLWKWLIRSLNNICPQRNLTFTTKKWTAGKWSSLATLTLVLQRLLPPPICLRTWAHTDCMLHSVIAV